MVAKGCTAAYDLFYEFPTPSLDGMEASAEAYHEVGMRAVIAPMVADRTVYEAIPGLMDALPEGLQAEVAKLRMRPPEETLGAIGQVLDKWSWAKHDIRAAVAPTIPHHCSDGFMCGCRDLARKHGLGLHSHVGESKVQAITGIKRYGKTLIAHMDALGLIDENFTAAHAIWLNDNDMRIVRDRGGSLAHNPGSNMRLGNGMFRLKRALELGVNVGVGTDGFNCSDNGNMYEAMRAASLLSKIQTPDPGRWGGGGRGLSRRHRGLGPGARLQGYRRAGARDEGGHRLPRPHRHRLDSAQCHDQPDRPFRGFDGGAAHHDRRRVRLFRPQAHPPRRGQTGPRRGGGARPAGGVERRDARPFMSG